jgi:topoisomerase-4 subunit A
MTKQSEQILDVAFKDAISERYLAYAMSTITSRSLPDVRDGLKPVHRRLLYAMLQLRLDPKSGFKKCARVVGDVMGKYHPHGDMAIYDTMVRLAQSFSVRYMLVDGQGNFGSIDGDNAAAMRYTEARLTEVAMALMEGIDADTVDFRETYDGEDSEPMVMPAGFPNLLANGSEGIAVGMATSIPPHNAGEICDALLYLIKSPNAAIDTLLARMPGPDFPTGGIIAEPPENILRAYTEGKGGIRLRARWEKEELGRGNYQIIITEIPYQVQKDRLIERMAEQLRNKKTPLMANLLDESAEDIRIVIEPKSRTVDPELLMESLYKVTDLETRFNLNLNVLRADGVPQVMNLRELLQAFLDHRHEVLVRRTKFRLEKIERRLEILDGLLICFLNLDEVIRIIREEDEAKQVLIKTFDLTENQVEAILNMRLRQLRKLEEIEIKKEHKALKAEQKELKALLKDEAARWAQISDEIKDIKKRFGQATVMGARRTDFGDAPDPSKVISIEAFIEKEPITVVCSKLGWVRAFKGHFDDLPDLKFKEGDEAAFQFKAKTTDKILIFGSDGRFYTLNASNLPPGKGHGEPIRLMIDLEQSQQPIVMKVHDPEAKLLVASSIGKGFIVEEKDVVASTKGGKQVLNVASGKAIVCREVVGDHVAVIGTNRKLLVFPLDQIPPMKRGQGVGLQKYKGAELADAKCFTLAQGLSWQVGERTRLEEDMSSWLGNRATAGRLPPVGFPRSNVFGDD